MADDERRWRRQHVHEAAIVSYGHFSTDNYDEYGHEWIFLRDPIFSSSSLDGQSSFNQYRILHEHVLHDPREMSSTHFSDRQLRGHAISSELSAAGYSSKNIDHSTLDLTHRGRCAAFLYGSLAQNDHNVRGSAIAFVTGHAHDQLQMTPVGCSPLHIGTSDNNAAELEVPVVSRRASVFWRSRIGPILQLEGSLSDQSSKRISYLAVRCASATHIFEAVALGQPHAFTTSETPSPVDATREPVITLPSSATGGYLHADCALRPEKAKQLGIVDVQGNWSVWDVSGQNTRSAKISHQAQLKCFGKLFAWSEKTRPDGFGLYFDGWHKIVWTSSDGVQTDRVLVCNRQMVKVFDLHGTETAHLDPRLGYRRGKDYILDVKVVRLNIILILTTSKVLVFDSSRADWKDQNRPTSVAMVCAVQHGYSPQDLELSMTFAECESQLLLVLYTRKVAPSAVYKLRISDRENGMSITVSDAIQLSPFSSHSRVSSIAFSPLERHVLRSDDDRIPCLFLMVVSFVDLSIKAFIIDFGILSGTVLRTGQCSELVRLPLKKSGTKTKSSAYVDEEDDLLDFVEPDVYSQSLQTSDALQQFTRPNEVKRRHLKESALTRICNHLVFDEVKTNTVRQALGQIVELLSAISTEELEFTAGALTELSPSEIRVEDVDADSARTEEFHTQLRTRYSHSFQTLMVPNNSRSSLLDLYEELFEIYIGSLPAAVPGRIRLNRERQLRDVALDINLASCIVVPKAKSEAHSTQNPPSQQPHNQDEDPYQAIHSDPLHAPFTPIASSPEPRIVATQAETQDAVSVPPSITAESSPIQAAISRLSAYTPVVLPPRISPAESSAANSSAHSILAHLPASADTSPDTYDYAAVEFDLSVTYHAQHTSAKEREAERKRAERISRAREKAVKRQKVVNERSAIPSIGTILTVSESGPVQHASARAGHVLPIRGVQSSQGGAEASSSQSRPGISMTQPEVGAFGQRRNKADGKKSKTKRRAGF